MNRLLPPLFEIGKAIHPGIKRAGKPNQDSLDVVTPLLHRHSPLLVITDGMGGHTGGELASQCVMEAFTRPYRRLLLPQSPESYLQTAVERAHRLVCKKARMDEQLGSMGSTVVAAIIEKNMLHLINVGDSRLYVFRDQEIQQISFDQSWVAEMVRAGVITQEEARNHPKKNQLTMSITPRRSTILSFYTQVPLEANDIVLLCSDGLWGVVSEAQMRAVACQLRPQAAADKLVYLANAMSGPDNISVIVARRMGSPLEEAQDDTE